MKILLLILLTNGNIYHNIMNTTIEECHALGLQLQLKNKNIILYECFETKHIIQIAKGK